MGTYSKNLASVRRVDSKYNDAIVVEHYKNGGGDVLHVFPDNLPRLSKGDLQEFGTSWLILLHSFYCSKLDSKLIFFGLPLDVVFVFHLDSNLYGSMELMLSEDQNGMVIYCFGVVHNDARDQPNLLHYIADKYPRTEVRFSPSFSLLTMKLWRHHCLLVHDATTLLDCKRGIRAPTDD